MASLTLDGEVMNDDEALADEDIIERKISLNEQRLSAIVDLVKAHNVASIIDLGCGEGKLLQRLLQIKTLQRIVGMDVSTRCLEKAEQRLRLERKPEKIRNKLQLIQGALHYRDARLEGLDMAACIEVIEHMDEDRLDAFEKVVFQHARPKIAVVTMPNAEYNVKFEGLPQGVFRHGDHRFEWDRKSFQRWAAKVAERFGYAVEYGTVGEADAAVGPPTQMAVFSRVAQGCQ